MFSSAWGSILDRRVLCTLSLLIAAFGIPETVAAQSRPAEVLGVQKIWEAAPHNAFTDLIWHEGRFWCVFREGARHVSPDGALRVLSSQDGKSWSSAALIKRTDADLRDAKITVAPGGELMLCGAGALHEPINGATHQSYIWYSKDGRDWGESIPVGDPGYWLWRVTWHAGTAYAVGYATGGKRSTRLYQSRDGRHFEVLVPELFAEGYPNESSLLFQADGTALCLMRRDDKESPAAMLGSAATPYTDWTFRSLGTQIGGPQLLKLADGRIVVGGRDYVGKAKTNLWLLDTKAPGVTAIATLPSGGDTSYPGLVERDGLLWVSYYSTHEGKTSIYLARVRLPAIR
jgi:hypothetical protein